VQHGALLGAIDRRAGKHRIACPLPPAGLRLRAQRLQGFQVEFLPAQIEQDRPHPLAHAFAAHRLGHQFAQRCARQALRVACEELGVDGNRMAIGRHGHSRSCG